MKRARFTIFFASLVPALAWVGGFNFDERGPTAFATALITIFAGYMAWTYPGSFNDLLDEIDA